MDEKKFETIKQLQHGDVIYAIMSGYTNMPYVECDEETYDDKVFVYFDEERAKEAGSKLMQDKNLVQVAMVPQDQFLPFYTNLFSIGVNCIHVERGFDGEIQIQREDLIRRQKEAMEEEGRKLLENPEFQLTALYFSQEFRKNPSEEMSDELFELYEEMLAHFERGVYILPSHEENGIPVLRQQEGKGFLPLFTDVHEFQKFNRDGSFKGGVIEAKNVPNVLTDEMEGVVVNPFGVNIILTVGRKEEESVM